ncbi:MAG: ABC transporter substrate-binding protein, partial [Burkholderiales bacterium]|nr:ABC transporter substrate-binding protein [Burkholderiales bacterium]
LLQRGMQMGAAATVLGAQQWLHAQGATKLVPDVHVAIGVQQTASLANLPLLLAHELSFFKAEGILLDWVPLASEAAGTQALAKGHVHMVSCDFGHALLHHAHGGDLTAFVVQARTPQMVFGVLPRALAGYRQFSDLKGRRVCTLPPSAASQLVINSLMHEAGMSGVELSIVSIAESANLVDQLRNGGMDAFCMDHATVAALEQRGEVRLVADTRTLKGTLAVFGGPMPGAVVCAPASYLQQRPDTCQAVASAVVRALKWLRTAGPSDLVKALASVSLDADRVNYLTALEKSRDGFMGDGVLSDVAAATALTAVNRMDAQVPLSRVRLMQAFTNEFALRAKARWRV